MKTRMSFTKLLLAFALLAGLLLTAYAGQAASAKSGATWALQAHSPVVVSALRVELVSSKVSAMVEKGLNKTSAKKEAQPSDDKGGLRTGLAQAAAQPNADKNVGEDQHENEITGTVTSIVGDTWMISGVTVRIDKGAEIKSGLGVGSLVKAEGQFQADGSFLARDINPLDVKLAEDEKAGEDEILGENESNEIEDNQGQNEAGEDKSGQGEDNQGQNDNADDHGVNPTAQAGRVVEFTGQLSAVNGDIWTVNGMSVVVSAATEVKDNPMVGDTVKVEGMLNSNGSVQGTQIKLRNSNGENEGQNDESSAPSLSPSGSDDQQNASPSGRNSNNQDDRGQNSGQDGGHGGGGHDGGGHGSGHD